jgi:hypothetical protein
MFAAEDEKGGTDIVELACKSKSDYKIKIMTLESVRHHDQFSRNHK